MLKCLISEGSDFNWYIYYKFIDMYRLLKNIKSTKFKFPSNLVNSLIRGHED